MDGERIVARLIAHRDLWQAVLLDRLGVPNYADQGQLLTSGLIKLRDLPEDYWNADKLFILTLSSESARRLAQIIEKEDWGGAIHVYVDRRESDRALGTGGEEYGLLSVWWD